MSTSMVNMSTRLEEELHNVVIDLKSKGQLGAVLRLMLNAIKQDKTATLQFLLGIGTPSISKNKFQDSVVRANLFERYLALGIEQSFDSWVSELSQAEIEVNSGLTFARVDLQDIIASVVDDLGLELIPKGSAQQGISTGVDISDLEALVSKMVDDRVGRLSPAPVSRAEASQTIGLPVEETVVKPTVSETIVSEPVVETSEVATSEVKPAVVESEVSEVQPTVSEDSPVEESPDATEVDVMAMMSGLI